MKHAYNFQMSSSMSKQELEASMAWLDKVLNAFEAQSSGFVKEYFKSDATFELGETGTLVGQKALQECSDWIANGISKWDLTLKSAHFVPDQIVFVVEGEATIQKGPRVPLNWVVTVDKSLQSPKVQSAKIYGEVAPLMNHVAKVAGPVQGISVPGSVKI